MHFQEIRRAAAQGTISLPPPMDSEGLEDLAVLKSCLKVIRELSGFRYAFAKDAMAETFAPLMASVEAKNELERQGLKVSLKSYFLSLILKDLGKLCKIRNFSQSPFGGFISEESDGNFPSGRN